MESTPEMDSSSSSSPPISSYLKRKRGSGTESPDDDFDPDVFISFRGEDTRASFTSHVHAALCRKEIKAFIDSQDLRKGHELRGSLLKAIENSKLYLIIFSPNYASSKWCLMELEKILQCKKQLHGKKKMVIPVFYKVDPTHVRHQTGSFEDAFTKHEAEEEKEKVLKWRVALNQVASLSGLHLKEHQLETEFINEIVETIQKELPPQALSKLLFGINGDIEKVLSLLGMGSSEVRSVGLWGMGGIGKTTIAEAVFHSIDHTQFDGCHFLVNAREKIKRLGGDAFWNNVLSEILGRKNSFTLSLSISSVKQSLRRRRVLIVIDDVDESVFLELQDLAEHHSLFGAGSTVLLTSRDRHVLTKFLVNDVYEVLGLQDDEEALRLFSSKAFKKESPPVEFEVLSDRVVHYAQGNPLALTVLGSALLNRDRDYWDEALHEMKCFPKESILDLLRISYAGLSSREEKDIFLDIACFFKGERIYQVLELLACFYDPVRTSIIHLIEKSLITISEHGMIELHDLVQEMAWKMDDEEEVSKDPRKRKRLHKSKDVHSVLMGKKGTEAIQGISLDLSEVKAMSFGMDAFAGMVNLRWLKVRGQNNEVCLLNTQRTNMFWWLHIFGNNSQVFLPQMRYLHWEAFPFTSLSSTFNVPNLVKLELPGSKLERLWTGIQDVANLRWMALSESPNLTEIPDLSKAKNLECMFLGNCKKLTRLHPSVQYLKKLQVLNLYRCSSLFEIPSVFESQVLEELFIHSCKKLKVWPKIYSNNLDLLGLTSSEMNEVPDCSGFQVLTRLLLYKLPNLTKFPEPLPCSLEELLTWGTGIEEVPSSIQLLPRLRSFWCLANNKLRNISDRISRLQSLTHIYVQGCKLLVFIPVLPTSLNHLEVIDCPSLERVSPICNQSQMEFLRVMGCGKLDNLSLVNIMRHLFFKLQHGKEVDVVIQGSEFPEWFPPENACLGSSITFPILHPDNHQKKKNDTSPGFALCLVFEFDPLYIAEKNLRIRIECRPHPQVDNPDQNLLSEETEITLDMRFNLLCTEISDQLTLFSIPESMLARPTTYSSMSLQFTPLHPHVMVRKCGVCSLPF